MSTLVGDPLEEPMPLGAATVYLNKLKQKVKLKKIQERGFEVCTYGTVEAQRKYVTPRHTRQAK